MAHRWRQINACVAVVGHFIIVSSQKLLYLEMAHYYKQQHSGKLTRALILHTHAQQAPSTTQQYIKQIHRRINCGCKATKIHLLELICSEYREGAS